MEDENTKLNEIELEKMLMDGWDAGATIGYQSADGEYFEFGTDDIDAIDGIQSVIIKYGVSASELYRRKDNGSEHPFIVGFKL